MNNSEISSESAYIPLTESVPTVDKLEEAAHISGTASLASIPFAGGALSAIFSGAYMMAEQKRQFKWFEEVAKVVDRLASEKRLTVDGVLADDRFAAALMKGSRIVRETASVEKRTALANAVCNSGSWSSNESATDSYFMRVLERYEPEHIVLLRGCDDPERFAEIHGSRLGNGELHRVFANLIYDGVFEWEPLGTAILRDLNDDGLLTNHFGMGFNLIRDANRLTAPLGQQFLAFCSDPETVNEVD